MLDVVDERGHPQVIVLVARLFNVFYGRLA